MKPYCFVLMPFGIKLDSNGNSINFDAVYAEIIKPSIISAGLEPIRADEEKLGGIIHKPMFERLMMCEYAIADLTTANANVFYELGVRHGIRPHSTTLIFSDDNRLPFDVAPLRSLPYKINERGQPEDAESDIKSLTQLLIDSREPIDDSPVYQLVTGMPRIEIDRLKTDTFREAIVYDAEMKNRLREARTKKPDTLIDIENELSISDCYPPILIDLLLSYRAVDKWENMVNLIEAMPPRLSRTVLAQEQYGFALNRLGRSDEAEHILKALIKDYGPSSETNGILGRVYKDRWKAAKESHDPSASGHLIKAINAYAAGFEIDWRDAYPGVNAVTLMEMLPKEDPRQKKILPVVRYSSERRLESTEPNYWDYATLLELSILDVDKAAADNFLGLALASAREPWEKESTAGNLRLIREKRQHNNVDVDWIIDIEQALRN
jgi:tetratricopeptide (TPR) repeat protein